MRCKAFSTVFFVLFFISFTSFGSVLDECQQSQCVAVVDAGSSGSRVHVYQIVNNDYRGFVSKLEPYTCKRVVSYQESFKALLQFLNQNNFDELQASTEIMIIPGYDFKVCNHLITNFHQPESTLMLLVAAFVGNDWRAIYNYALNNEFRFLSYGDSSLLSRNI